MKKVILTYGFILLMSTVHLFGQDTLLVTQAKVDSVKHLIDSRKKDDEEKVRLLNEYALFCFYNQEYKKGFDSAILGRKISNETNFDGGLALYYNTLAAVLTGPLQDIYYDISNQLAFRAQRLDLIHGLDYPAGYPHPRDSIFPQKMLTIKDDFLRVEEKEIYAIILHEMAMHYYRYIGWQASDIMEKLEDEAIEIYQELNLVLPMAIFVFFKELLLKNTGRDSLRLEYFKEMEIVLTNNINSYEYLSDYQLGEFYSILEKPSLAIKHNIKALNFYQSINNDLMISRIYDNLNFLYGRVWNYSKQVETCEEWIRFLKNRNLVKELDGAYRNIYSAYINSEEYDKFLQIADSVLYYSINPDRAKQQIQHAQGLEALSNGNFEKALEIFQKRYNSGNKSISDLYDMASVYFKMKEYKKAEKFILFAINQPEINWNRYEYYRMNSLLLGDKIYESLEQYDKAHKYLREYQVRRDELFKSDWDTKMSEGILESTTEITQNEIEELEKEQFINEQQNKVQRLWIFSISGALLSALLVAFILYRNNKSKQKAKQKIEKAYTELKATQSQLIQSEKMASLGELTAGIAHEIQNPLNFVNNFSEVSKELLDEMKEELATGNLQPATEISDDINQNLEKILHHGKRAESIVKGMLQHSRTSSGEKELTDINALADEYLRLSYQGLRAKDKSFNADFKLEADESLPKIDVIPQDIGRVLLNLINNAFYACAERSRSTVDIKAKEMPPPSDRIIRAGQPPKGEIESARNQYEPTVTVTTSHSLSLGEGRGEVKITVKDNGPGIPDSIKDKIFQPFFTTKPTGSGTGLGLSLSYDIVKAHGGELKVETKEGKGTEFIIQLSIKTN